MTYASLLKIPETLRSSTGLAALASLGVHGLLWAVLPVLPFESKSLESQSQQTVGLIQLTPEEQSRLPSTSEVTLPPFATQQSVLPPLPPPPFQMSALPPLPAFPQSFQLPPNSIPKNFTAPSPATKTVRVPPPPPTKTAINKPAGSGGNRTYYSDELLSAPRRWTPPLISGLPTNRLTAQPFDPNNFPPAPPTVPVPTPIVPENLAPPQNTNPPQQKVATANPTPLTPTAPPQKVPEKTKRELLALRDQLARANRATSATPAPANTPAGMTRQQIVQALRRSPPQPNQAGVSVATADTIQRLEKFNAQQQRVQSEYPKVETKAPIRQKIATCEKQVDGGVAYVKAVVNPQGKIISGPELFDNKGAVDIAQAKAIVSNYPFQADSNTTNYNFTIEFNYDTGKCPETTPDQSPDTQA